MLDLVLLITCVACADYWLGLTLLLCYICLDFFDLFVLFCVVLCFVVWCGWLFAFELIVNSVA